ncbi:MAG: Hsp20/alpha crystallin family protein [Planctomycetota bacterium]
MFPTLRKTFDSPFDLIREVDRALGSYHTPAFPVDIHETGEHFVIQADLPGYPKDHIELNLDGNVLELTANRVAPEASDTPEGRGEPRVTERVYGKVQRSFRLPDTVDPSAIDAQVADGVLTVTLGKRDEVKPRRISVN